MKDNAVATPIFYHREPLYKCPQKLWSLQAKSFSMDTQISFRFGSGPYNLFCRAMGGDVCERSLAKTSPSQSSTAHGSQEEDKLMSSNYFCISMLFTRCRTIYISDPKLRRSPGICKNSYVSCWSLSQSKASPATILPVLSSITPKASPSHSKTSHLRGKAWRKRQQNPA